MPEPYKLSFTAGSLLIKESVVLAELYLKISDWEQVKIEAFQQNTLQTRTQSSAKRTIREVCHRLKALTGDELNLLVEGPPQEQASILWVATCRYYRFIAEFASDVIREKFISMSTRLEEEDFDFFFNKKAECHDELEDLQQVTRNKLKQVTFRMLREAGIVTRENNILPAILSPNFVDVISRKNRQDLLFFPVYEHQLNRGAL